MTTPLPFRRALPWLFLITGVFFINFIARTIFSPLMLEIELDLAISHSTAGRFYLDIALGYAVMLMASGYVSHWLTHRTCIALMPILTGAALIGLSVAHSLIIVDAMFLLVGLTAGLYLPSGIAAISSLVSARRLGMALSVHELAPNLAFVLGPVLAEMLLALTDWRGAVGALGAASLVYGLLYLLIARGGEFKGMAPSFSLARSIIFTRQFWGLGILFCLAIGASFAPYSVLPLFLVNERAMDSSTANTLLSVSRLSGPFMVLVAGWLTDRFGPKLAMSSYFLLGGLSTIGMGILHGPWLVAAIIIQPLLSVCFFPAGFAALATSFPKGQQNLVVALVIPMGVLSGNGIFPHLLGVMGDHASFDLGFILIGAALLAGLLLVPTADRPCSSLDSGQDSP